MSRIREYFNWNVIIWFMLFIGVFIFFGCGNTDESTVDNMLVDSSETEETTQDPVVVDGAIPLEVLTFTIDATSNELWTYFSFTTGDVVEVEDADNSNDWDIGFQRTKVKLNGGISGPGMGSVVMLTETEFEDVTVAPEDGYLADTEDSLAIVPQSEKGWYIYTGPPTHWVLPLENRVFVIKAADGTFSKLRFVGYYKDNENKQDSGFVTFDYVHQPDGSSKF